MNKVTVDARNRDNKVTEDGVIINKGNRPQDVAFAINVIRALIDDRSFDLKNYDGTCIATKQVAVDYVKFSPKEHWYA